MFNTRETVADVYSKDGKLIEINARCTVGIDIDCNSIGVAYLLHGSVSIIKIHPVWFLREETER